MLAQQLLAQRHVGRLVGQRRVLVREEVAELRLLLVADRLLERDRRLRRAQDLLDLVERQVEVARDLDRQSARGRARARSLRSERTILFSFSTTWTGIRIVRALVGERARDRLADPPGRVGRELEALALVELLGGAHEADRPLLDQVEERQPLVAVALRDRDDEAEVRLDHLLLRAMVAALDPLRELDLLRGGEQLDLADVLEEELERVGRDLADGLVEPRLLLRLRLRRLRVDDLDLQLLERAVDVVDLRRLEIELVERERDLLGADPPGGLAASSRLRASSVSRTSLGDASTTAVSAMLPLLRDAGGCHCSGAGRRHRPFGSYFLYLDLVPGRRESSLRASCPYAECGPSADREPELLDRLLLLAVQSRRRPRWKRTTAARGKTPVSGPSRAERRHRVRLREQADGRGACARAGRAARASRRPRTAARPRAGRSRFQSAEP